MNINKELIMKHLTAIICVVSVILLFLPFVNATAEASFMGTSVSASESMSGFDAIFEEGGTVVAWLLLICPILMVVVTYVKQIEKFKKLAVLILPAVSILAAILCLFLIGPEQDIPGVEFSITPHVGFFLLIVAYIGTFIAGAMSNYGLKLSKEGFADFANQVKK